MSSFDDICKVFEQMDPEDFVSIFNEKSVDVIAALMSITENGKDGLSAYINFILAAVAADGVLAPEEFVLVKPLFDREAGKDVTYEEAVEIFKNLGLDDPQAYKDAVDTMVDVIGLVSEELKDDIVLLSLMVCAVDGEVSDDEKKYIKQLIDPLTIEVSAMEYIDDFLGKAKVFMLATEDGDQPKMRVLGFKALVDDKIYFAVGTFKDVYKQLQANPKCEILASVGADFIRWDGKAVFTDDPRLPAIAAKAMPQVAQMYAANGWTLGFFTIEGGHAESVNVSNKKTQLF